MLFTSSKCSLVLRYTTELEPHELLPTIPPIHRPVGRRCFRPKEKPCGFRNILSSSRITPGCTLTHFSSSHLSSSICVKFFETSTMIPLPTTCPASEVPAVRGISAVFSRACKSNQFLYIIYRFRDSDSQWHFHGMPDASVA